MFDTIAAISTGNTNQAISIIRISGENAFSIIKKISSLSSVQVRKIQLASITENHELVDKVVITSFNNPHSYTGEDIVEINAHGGVVVTQRILKLCLLNGARLAEPGEFSKRAFLNGKINLIEAEGINNLIHAQSVSQSKIAAKNLKGRSSKIITNLKEKILEIIGIIEINIDYPEYDDIEILTTKSLLPKLTSLQTEIQKIIESSILTHKLYEGVNVVIVGNTNSGKSTLLNALLQESKAIVSSTPGTTRDVVEGHIEIEGVLFHFFDTAGIRKSKNKIENLGIKKTLEKLKSADLIIHLIDPTQKENHLDHSLIKGKEVISINSKSDLVKTEKLSISKNNIEPLIKELSKRFSSLNLQNTDILISTRQQALLESSLDHIKDSINGLKNHMTPDVVIVDIQDA
jgi:tRNA modification GTPase